MVSIKTQCKTSLQSARENHLQWAKIQRQRRYQGKSKVARVGGETFHRKWARIYGDTIRVLEQPK